MTFCSFEHLQNDVVFGAGSSRKQVRSRIIASQSVLLSLAFVSTSNLMIRNSALFTYPPLYLLL